MRKAAISRITATILAVFLLSAVSVPQDTDASLPNRTDLSVLILVDVSPSAEYGLDAIKKATASLVERLDGANVSVIAFSEDRKTIGNFGEAKLRIIEKIRRIDVGGGTSVYDVLDYALADHFQTISGPRAIILISDAVDTTSRRTNHSKLMKLASESGIAIFPIYLDSYEQYAGPVFIRSAPGNSVFADIVGQIIRQRGISIPQARGTSKSEYAQGRSFLEMISSVSGGRIFEPEFSENGLLDAAANVAGLLKEIQQELKSDPEMYAKWSRNFTSVSGESGCVFGDIWKFARRPSFVDVKEWNDVDAPKELGRHGIYGDVPVVITIDAQGNILKARAFGGRPELRSIAEAAVKDARFEPPLLCDGEEVVVQIRSFRFDRPKSLSKIGKKREKAGEELVEALGELSKNDKKRAPAEVFENASRLYQELGDNFGAAFIAKETGLYILRNKEYDKAIEHLKNSLDIYQANNAAYEVARLNQLLGQVYAAMGRNGEALSWFTKSIEAYSEFDDHTSKARILSDFAAIHSENGKDELALKALEKSVVLFELGTGAIHSIPQPHAFRTRRSHWTVWRTCTSTWETAKRRLNISGEHCPI
ncbi:MAG TPA: tetratricopeptide repeat protein [Aridibacter sp.]|nr:tetratricopeptide repeat protein [Aridibacter sp.]